MNYEGREKVAGTLDHRFSAFYQVQDLNAAVSVMRNDAGEPMPARLDKV